jgi:hypothetical protein
MTGLFGQEPNINFTYKVDSTVINNNVAYSISINIISGNYPINIYLFDKVPWNGGKEIKKEENNYVSSYTFSKLPKGNYFIVLKNNESAASKSLKIK